MGSAQSYISSEAALTTLVVAGAIGLGYTKFTHGATSTTSAPTATSSSADATLQTDKSGQPAEKGKKKKQTKSSIVLSGDMSGKGLPTTSSTTPAEPERVVNTPTGFPGEFESTATPDSQLSDVAAAAASLSKVKKSKKKKTKAAAIPDTIVQQVAASSSAEYSSEISVKPKVKNAKRHQQQPQPTSSQLTRPLHQSTVSIDTDGSWTRVGSGRRDTELSKISTTSLGATTSDADTGFTPRTGDSSPIAGRGTESEEPSSFLLDIGSRDAGENRRKTLAEKLLPKPRKTGVDDMLETPDYPTLSRVMRVQPLPDEKPALGFSWADYEDVRVTTDGGENDADGEDDSWGVVRSKRQRVDRTSTLSSSSHHPHQAQRATETMTKRKRQNAQKRESEKAAKAEAEVQRLAVLAKHKRELESIRALEQYSSKSGGKLSGGGMKASVDERGKLVWE
ncbi:hypothetical protein BYT27DRAFT_7182243 [Phlegmacium glaucopus]|nr:hypothetical protein BYT27DRAFT_7182243 [Phlegmacium glaucopus]